jgi:acyl-ACP thioesterase
LPEAFEEAAHRRMKLGARDHEPVEPAEFVESAPDGRRVVRTRRVRLGDVTTSGRLRLDALARYLQDVASDDVDDVGIRGAWVLRRTTLRLGDLPRFRDEVELTTFCSGTGPRWAERRTSLRVGDRVAVEAVALWVYVDGAGRPVPLEDWFFDWYGTSARGRVVSSRLRHPRPPADLAPREWPLRRTDFDVLEHVNNAVSWQSVEGELARLAPGRRFVAAEMEYRVPVDPGETLAVVSRLDGDRLECWLVCDGEARTSAVVELGPV